MYCKPVMLAALLGALLWSQSSAAQVFEVIHPDVVKGGFEFEALNGIVLDSVEAGDERSAHEIAIGYSPTDFWKTTLAIEIANPEDEGAKYEALEWVNVVLLPFGEGHGAGHSHDHGGHDLVALEAIGIFTALEVPDEGGIDEGALEVGPVAEIAFGPLATVTNLFLVFPFADGESTGVGYAVQARYPVAEQFAVGGEAYGEVENAFEGDSEDEHFIGPAFYAEFDLGRGFVLEPRLAFLFGLTEDAPDAIASLNFELKF